MSSSKLYKVEAIILKRKNIGEADRILTIFTKEYGKLKVLAKGIRRITSRRGPHVEVFSHLTMILYRGKTWDIVSEAQTLEVYSVLRKKLDRVSTAYYMCELVDGLLPEKQEHRDIFYLLLEELKQLNELANNKIGEHSHEFSLELLRTLGFLRLEKHLEPGSVQRYIENILEKRLKTPKIMAQLA